jgi:hypothetical protein
MNASVAALPREHDVQSKIQKVSTFSRYARVVCSAAFGFGVVGSALAILVGALSIFIPALPSDAGMAPHQKMWALPLFALTATVWLGVVYQLYRLFGDLASGSIYTAANVRRVRLVGLLWLLSAVLGVLIPLAWAGLVASGLVEPSDPPKLQRWLSWPDSIAAFGSAGLILLISWVMDIGLYEKDLAAALQRDADLVI